MTFRGLTWDHPRGYDALAEAARRLNQGRATPLITWDKQPLEGFESAPIAELAARYDLLVLDHPHIGEAVASDCLHPLEDLFSETQIAEWKAQSVGPSLTSYACEGKTWALPLDVATQVMARRANKVATPPDRWEAVLEIAAHVPVAQSLAGPHAVLSLFSMVAGMGGTVGEEILLPGEEAEEALTTMHRLYALRPKGSERLNPIALSEAMVGGDIALVPLLFGYVNYAQTGMAGQLSFSDTIGVSTPGTGGVIGGTGVGFAKHSKPSPGLLDHIVWLMRPDTQRQFIPSFGGQPSARAAWQDQGVNKAWGGFYQQCLATAENALLRPRFDGYIAFQTQASERLRQALETSENENTALAALRQLWRDARANASSPLESS
ncbi:MAG: extracellular solute-binding protein [Cohaesibacteraceae bacterium]